MVKEVLLFIILLFEKFVFVVFLKGVGYVVLNSLVFMGCSYLDIDIFVF